MATSPISTAALAVELLVIGYQTLIWLVLAACLSPSCDKALLTALKDWTELLVIVSAALAYTSGTIMNGVTARIAQGLDRKVYEKTYRKAYNEVCKKPEKPSEIRGAILMREPEALLHIMKNLEAPRVLRSTTFNILLIGVFTVIHLGSSSKTTCLQLLLVALLFLVGVGLAAWAWYETTENFYIHLVQTYKALTKSEQPRTEPGH